LTGSGAAAAFVFFTFGLSAAGAGAGAGAVAVATTGADTTGVVVDFSVDLDALTILAIIFDYIVSFLSYFFDNIYI
jgi:hypothetical protein